MLECDPTERPPLDEFVMLHSSRETLSECEMWRRDPSQEHTRDLRWVMFSASLEMMRAMPVNEQSLKDDMDIDERVITEPVWNGEMQ